jgi:hypothetical protein
LLRIRKKSKFYKQLKKQNNNRQETWKMMPKSSQNETNIDPTIHQKWIQNWYQYKTGMNMEPKRCKIEGQVTKVEPKKGAENDQTRTKRKPTWAKKPSKHLLRNRVKKVTKRGVASIYY